MKISTEFSKFANEYNKNNIIQNKVADKLLRNLICKPKNILDIGCGSGAICKRVDWKYDSFTGIDFAKGMLDIHPKSQHINCVYGDFNDENFLNQFIDNKYDYIISASALQWANDLDSIFYQIGKFNTNISLAIFTSNTFKTLHKTASLDSILKDTNTVNELQKKYLNCKSEVVNYKLEFNSIRDMFRYIKQSGVSASRNVLGYKETKKLMEDYPLNYLEFEVIFIYSH